MTQKGIGPFLDASNPEHWKIFADEVARHGKWTRETVWIYRNDREDIMRAQDEHPTQGIKDSERILQASRGDIDDTGRGT